MPDILICGVDLSQSCFQCDIGATSEMDGRCPYFSLREEQREPYRLFRHPDCPLHELPPHGDLIETKDVLLALVEHGQRDKRFKLGDTIRYSPSEVKEIIDASVPVVVPAERSDYQ